MVDSFVLENIKRTLECDKLQFLQINWIWCDGITNNLTLEIDDKNSVDGILVFNFGITTTSTGIPIIITDRKVLNQIVYRHPNVTAESFIQPFIYFSVGNTLRFRNTILTNYGFNYVTIRKG